LQKGGGQFADVHASLANPCHIILKKKAEIPCLVSCAYKYVYLERQMPLVVAPPRNQGIDSIPTKNVFLIALLVLR
jgi:hypothetical protein